MKRSAANLCVPMHLKIMSYVSSALRCTPLGNAGCKHCASLFPIVTLFGITGYFTWLSRTYNIIEYYHRRNFGVKSENLYEIFFTHSYLQGGIFWRTCQTKVGNVLSELTLFNFPKLEMRSAHSLVYSNDFNAFSTWDI